MLPEYCIVHKQDIFLREQYRPELQKENLSFLARSFERHFNEREFFAHTCYLFLTKTTRERSRRRSDLSMLCRGRIVPAPMTDAQTLQGFTEAVGQFERILADSGLVSLRRLRDRELTGTRGHAGIIERYLTLSGSETPGLQDIRLDSDRMTVGDKILALYTLSELDDLPALVGTDYRYDRLSTERSDCLLSFATPVGILLPCEHIYNQMIFLDSPAEILQRFEKNARTLHALSRYSRANAINKQWIDAYLNAAHSQDLLPVRVHCNVLAWARSEQELRAVRNEVGAQITRMGCNPRYNTIDTPTLFWAAIPGGEGGFPAEESFYTFAEQALCLFTEETAYRSSPSPFGIRLADRQTGRPVFVDISDEPMRRGITTNRNKCVIGPSGSGKSFMMNHLVRQYYEQGTHVVLVDTGNSYQGLCTLIHRTTGGRDGIYYTYSEKEPITFNPFYSENGVYDLEKKESIKTLLLTLWKREDEAPSRAEEVALSNAVTLYIEHLECDAAVEPSFDTFYEFVKTDYRAVLKAKKVREKDFDIAGFLNVLEPYYKGGEYDYLLNARQNPDLLQKRFIVFEIDAVKDHPILFPVVTIIIMELFISKMRRLQGQRKMLVIEEAWKALMKTGMADFVQYTYRTCRKFFGEAVVVTQELDDLTSPIIKNTILNNSDCKILLDMRKYVNRFDQVQSLLGLTDKARDQILSLNLANDPTRQYKEV